MSDNLLVKRRQERYKYLTEEKLEQIRLLEKNFDNGNVDTYQLKIIKRKRKIYPERGDIFIVNPKKDLYFYGVVVNSEVKMLGFDEENLYVVMIFRNPNKILLEENFNIEKNKKNFESFLHIDFNNLLIPPQIVSRGYWTLGYFYNIGISINIPQDLDYGFYHIGSDTFVNEYKEEMNYEPKLLGVFGCATTIGVGHKIAQELIIDDNLCI